MFWFVSQYNARNTDVPHPSTPTNRAECGWDLLHVVPPFVRCCEPLNLYRYFVRYLTGF